MRYIILIFMIVLASCGKKEDVKISKYVDVAGYFSKEAKRLTQENYHLEKSILTKKGQETITQNPVNWEEVLAPFISCDINKAAWINSYKMEADTTPRSNEISFVYTTDEEDPPVKKMSVLLVDQKITYMEVIKQKSGSFYSSRERYIYYSKGFEIKIQQKVRFMDETAALIKAQFIP